MNDKKDNYEIDAMHIIGMLLKRWWAILLFVLAFSLAAFGFTKLFVVPRYQSEATLLINGESSISSAYQQILAGQYQSKDYPYILQSNDTLSEAAERLNEEEISKKEGKKYTANSVGAMIKSEAVDESRIFRIVATSTDANEASLVAETVAMVFIERAEMLTSSDIRVVENPTLPTDPISAGYGRNILIGFAVGLIIGFAYAIIMGVVNDGIESEEWLLHTFSEDIPLLAVVPDYNSEGKGYYRYKYSKRYGYSTYEQKKNDLKENDQGNR